MTWARCAWSTCERWLTPHPCHLNQRFCSRACREKAYRSRINAQLAVSRQMLGSSPIIGAVNVERRSTVDRIFLIRTTELWLAVQNDPQIIELFGTAVLPTPYTAEVDADTVQREIAARNPDAEVLVMPDTWRHVDEPRPARQAEKCCFESCSKPATHKVGGNVYFPMCDEHAAETSPAHAERALQRDHLQVVGERAARIRCRHDPV